MATKSKKVSLELKEKYQDKASYDKKIGIVKRRIQDKEAYVSALEDYAFNLHQFASSTPVETRQQKFDRSKYVVQFFETKEKINAQKSILSQHLMYLEEMEKITPNE